MKNLFFMLLLLPSLALALEVDEKLTVRIVKTSESKKTVMLNRGTEDGLAENDHAKFIVTSGIVARAVCIKVSPTRSVWSVYRLVNADFIVNDSVMSIKITPPVKITKDDSQMLITDDVPSKVTGDPQTLGIPLAEGAQDLTTGTADEKIVDADLKALDEDERPTSIAERNREVFGFVHISGLTSNTKSNTGDVSFNNSQSYHHFGLGGEFYAQREREWYSKFSLMGGLSLLRENSQSYQGAGITNELTEFNFGVNWHPWKLPSTTGDFIPFFHLGFNIGSVKSTYKSGAESIGTPISGSANGSTSGFSVGFGYKFYTYKGWGARALLDYYMRTEKYDKGDLNGITFNKKVGGPRLLLGISYRF